VSGVQRVLEGVRNTLRLLSPSVRAERAYTRDREALIARASAHAAAGSAWLEFHHGRGIDERVVEYPWMFARLGNGATLLDVGSTLNHEPVIALVMSRYRRLVHLNPYRDDDHRSAAAGVRYVRADARRPALRGPFTMVTCLSTLEHVGCDNTRYGGAPAEADGGLARAAAMRAIRSLLAPGGRLLLTVPFGRAENHGWFVQLDRAMLDDAIAAFNPAASTVTFFLHAEGWRQAGADECAAARYGTRGSGAVACAELTA